MVAFSLGATSPKGEQMIPKGYKHTELEILPQDWEVVKLGEVCDVRDGTHESPKPKDEGKILITSKNLKNGRIDFSDSYYISLEDFESINKRSKVEKYDVLMSMIGTVGEVALINCVPDFAIKNVALFKTNGDIKLSRYLFYFFQSPSGKKCISSFLSGSTQKYITLDFLRNLQIPLPPLVEQEKIAEILGTWDTQIQNYESLIKEKQTLKKGLCQTLLTAKTRLKGFSEDWEVGKLSDVCQKMQTGGTPKTTNKKYYGGQIPFVKIADMTMSGKYLVETATTITEEGLRNSSAWLVSENNILYAMYASFGFVSINRVKVATSQAIMCISPKKNLIHLEYMFYILANLQNKIQKYVETGTQGNLNAKNMKSLQIPLPPLAEQEKIAEILSEADNEIMLLEQKLESLKSQKKGLMQKLLSGKIRVAQCI